jgi:hypothetical protein
MKNYLCLIFTLIFFSSNAQGLNSKKIQKLVKSLNENIQIIQNNRQEISNLNNPDSEEYYDLEIKTFLSPFWDYDFEVIEPFRIDENGNLSMKIKYFPADDEAFIYSVKGNLKDLERAMEDIYFVLEFSEDSLETTYEYLDSGRTENFNDSIIHFGIDQNNLMNSAEKAGINTEMY